jgi:ArsR family transcriptional regulator
LREDRLRQRVTRRRLDQVPVAGLTATLKALSDEIRLRILALLAGGEACVCDIVEVLGMPQNLVSHHLSVLRRAGLARDRRDESDGRWVYYSIDPGAVARLQAELGRALDLSRHSPAPARCSPMGKRAPR